MNSESNSKSRLKTTKGKCKDSGGGIDKSDNGGGISQVWKKTCPQNQTEKP
jgi:hypothetical protein